MTVSEGTSLVVSGWLTVYIGVYKTLKIFLTSLYLTFNPEAWNKSMCSGFSDKWRWKCNMNTVLWKRKSFVWVTYLKNELAVYKNHIYLINDSMYLFIVKRFDIITTKASLYWPKFEFGRGCIFLKADRGRDGMKSFTICATVQLLNFAHK